MDCYISLDFNQSRHPRRHICILFILKQRNSRTIHTQGDLHLKGRVRVKYFKRERDKTNGRRSTSRMINTAIQCLSFTGQDIKKIDS